MYLPGGGDAIVIALGAVHSDIHQDNIGLKLPRSQLKGKPIIYFADYLYFLLHRRMIQQRLGDCHHTGAVVYPI